MPAGIKCDADGCDQFAELPHDGMGNFQLLGNWLEVRLETGRFYACSPEHASKIADYRMKAQIEGINAANEDARKRNEMAQKASSGNVTSDDPGLKSGQFTDANSDK